MCVTLSAGVDSLIRRKQIGDMAQAAIIDSMASAAVEQVCDKVEEIIKKNFLIMNIHGDLVLDMMIFR